MSMRSTLIVMGVCAALTVVVAVPVAAHHAFPAEFDANRPVLLRGKIVKVEMVNPHAWIHILVPKEGGGTEEWMVEGGSPNTLLRLGVTKATLPIGAEVIVDGYQAKDRSNRANGRDITLSDGRKLFLGSSADASGAPSAKPSEPGK
jgi:hypothetical protein